MSVICCEGSNPAIWFLKVLAPCQTDVAMADKPRPRNGFKLLTRALIAMAEEQLLKKRAKKSKAPLR
jgi:hypothetical protein